MPKRKLHAINEKAPISEFDKESIEFKNKYGDKIDYTYSPSVYGKAKLLAALNKLGNDKYSGSLSLQYHSDTFGKTYGLTQNEFIKTILESDIGKANIDTVYLQSCNSGDYSDTCKLIKQAFGNKPIVGQSGSHHGFRRDSKSDNLKDILFSSGKIEVKYPHGYSPSEIDDKYGLNYINNKKNIALNLYGENKITYEQFIKLANMYDDLYKSIVESDDYKKDKEYSLSKSRVTTQKAKTVEY